MLYKVMVRHDHFPKLGELVELDAEAQQDWAASIDREWIVPVDDTETIAAPPESADRWPEEV